MIIMPIAGLILAFVMTLEPVQVIMEKTTCMMWVLTIHIFYNHL
jgi:hypothetical protein